MLLGFAGDVLLDREDPGSALAPLAQALAEPDVLFGNCETAFTSAPHAAPTSPLVLAPHPRNAEALAPFDVMSLANNHIVDCGHEALLETVERVRAVGVLPIGAGRDLAAARAPAILERDGVRVAYVAYASVFPYGYEARAGVPGLAPLRSHNHYLERHPNYVESGVPGRLVSVPDAEDHARLADDLAAAREGADVVVASFHWGDYRRPFVLTDHERRTARFAIEHGADVVVGHHHHTLRGIDWHRGRPVFYGLGHLVCDVRGGDAYPDRPAPGEEGDQYAFARRDRWPLLPMHPDARLTMLGWVELARDGTPAAAGFLPCDLTADGVVHPRDPEEPQGRAVVDYVRAACETQGLGVALAVDRGRRLGGLPVVRVTPAGNSAASPSPAPLTYAIGGVESPPRGLTLGGRV
jgi:hypothetical protein